MDHCLGKSTKKWQHTSHTEVYSTAWCKLHWCWTVLRRLHPLPGAKISNLPVSCLPAWSFNFSPSLVLVSAILVQSKCVNSTSSKSWVTQIQHHRSQFIRSTWNVVFSLDCCMRQTDKQSTYLIMHSGTHRGSTGALLDI